MNTFLNSALALAVASSLGFAGTSGNGDWSGLDQEINNLAATLGQGPPGVQMGALIRSSFNYSDDDPFLDADSDDLQGWAFQDIDAWLEGEVGDFDWRISFDFADSALYGLDPTGASAASGIAVGGIGAGVGTATIEDAYAEWMLSETLNITWGHFKAPTSRSAIMHDDGLVMINRTLIGDGFDSYQPGAMIGGSTGQFGWDVAIQNGADGTAEDILLSGRAQLNWNNGSGNVEGAYGAAAGTNGAFGFFYIDEGNDATEETVMGLDANITMDALSGYVEIADFDEADFTPWSGTLSYLFNSEFEGAFRYEDADDSNDSSAISAGVNWYHSGHNAKWQLNVVDVSSDDDTIEGTVFQLGLTLGASS